MSNNIPKIIFIVPYRNREQEKIHFSIYMKYIMEDYDIADYEIYFSHQTDERPFNRGATKNIGFLVMKNKYPNDYKNISFVFNDIDTHPAKKNTLNYLTEKGVVKHYYGVTFALGGIFSITGEDFEKCNGFPNNWGWGLEDNEIQKRVLKNQIVIDRSQFFPMMNKNIIQLFDSKFRLINNREPSKYKNNAFIDNLNSISNLEYNIEQNIKSSNIFSNSNEFIIHINEFNTLINPNNEIFYKQDILLNSKLYLNQYEKLLNTNKWSMKKL